MKADRETYRQIGQLIRENMRGAPDSQVEEADMDPDVLMGMIFAIAAPFVWEAGEALEFRVATVLRENDELAALDVLYCLLGYAESQRMYWRKALTGKAGMN